MAMRSDVRHALRGLGRTRLFTAAAIASLAVGIAAATVVFGLVDAALFRPPPFVAADRLTLLTMTQRTPSGGERRLRWSWPRSRLLARSVRSFDGVGSASNAVLTLTGVDDPEPVPVEIVSTSYLRVMRAPLALGGGFAPADDAEGAAPRVILGYDLWRRRFGGADTVVGRVVALNGVPLTIAGVAARGFTGVSGLAQAWVPASVGARVYFAGYLTTNENFITVVGRLRDGVSIDAARAELRLVGPRIQSAIPSEADTPQDAFSATLATLNEARIDGVTRRALALLSGAVAVLLLIACANVASLLLGRAASRQREIALRVAIGASRGRLVRQLLVESGVLAAFSGALGILVAAWTMRVVRVPPTLARGRSSFGAVGEFATPALDARVLAFAVAVCAVTVLLAGLAPALRATRPDLVGDLKAGLSRGQASGAALGLRELVVAVQLALSVMLLVGCGLLLTSYARLRDTRIGFDATHLLTFTLRPSEVRYPAPAAPALYDRVLAAIARVPGVEAATIDGCAPLAAQCASAPLFIVGRPWARAADAPSVLRHYVAPTHFRALGVPVVRGRGLTEGDRAGRPHVVVINEAAAARFWPNEDPVGKRVWFDGGATAFASPDSSAEIVGVVANVAYQPLDEAPVRPDFFTSYAQFTFPTRMVLVRTRGAPLSLASEIGRAVRRADPDLALFDVRTMEDRASLSWSTHRFQTMLLGAIAGIALALAVTGVYAVTAFFVASRTREIGVRMALGATDAQIACASVGRTVRLGLAGGGVGLVGAVALGRLLRATLYQTSPLDAGAFAGAVGVLVLALGAASYVPVRRALRVDPVEVLRSE